MNRTRQHAPASGRFALTVRRRYALWLRPLSLLLALCCFWSFAGSGIAIAATPQRDKATGKTAYHPFPHAPAFAAPPSPFHAAPAVLRSAPVWNLTQAASIAPRRPAVPSESLLDEVGRSAHGLPYAQAMAWGREIKAPGLTSKRAAELHLWLGEWELAQNQQPERARRHFRQARIWAHQAAGQPAEKEWAKRLYGLATYDSAVALYYEGAYQEATDAFQSLCQRKTAMPGYDLRTATLWWRHAGACAGYHADRSALGIPEPPRLDPLCGVAAVAASLRALALPFDRKTLLAACRVTGEGSTLDDLIASGRKLGVTVQPLSADEQGLMALPKPLIAYVEHDHFISVVRADKKGVSYLCSDCGAWPGGQVNLTWKQWRALEPGIYAVVTKPDSIWNRTLIVALDKSINSFVRVASVGSLAGLRSSSLRVHLSSANLLRHHVARIGTIGIGCGVRTTAQHCEDYVCCHTAGAGPGGGGLGGGPGGGLGGGPGGGPPHVTFNGPTGGDPVNLATLEEEYAPPTDLTVYNPHGPAITWSRIYNSLRRDEATYQEDDFGGQWSQPYNVQVYDPSVPLNSNTQITPGSSATFPATGSEAAGAGLTWDIVLNGATVATSASANGWAVSFSSSSPYGGSSGTFTLTAPVGTTAATGYKVRYLNTGYYGNAYASATLDVVSVYTVPQGGAAQLPAPGTDAPASGLSWDILCNGVTVATSAQPGNWQGGLSSYGSNATITVQTPLNAAIGTGYEVRTNSYGIHSAFFSVGPSRFAPTTGSGTSNQKFLVEPNGARTWFTIPTGSAPAPGQPVQCVVQPGAPLLVEWDYDSASSAGHYTLTWADRTKWVMNAPVKEIASGSGSSSTYGLLSSLARIVDRSGNALNFTYGYTNPTDNWPLLTGIADGNTGMTLLSISRDTTGFVTSVADAYGRSVVYSKDSATARLNQVSQIAPTGAANPPLRYTYGYSQVAASDDYPQYGSTFPFLHTITVPSPTGGGTSTATINYSTDMNASVTSIQDGNGYTTNFTVVDANHTQVTTKDAAGNQVYTYVGSFDGNLSKTLTTDGTGRMVSQEVYSDPNDPYRPSAVYDGNGFVAGSSTHIAPGGSATISASPFGYVYFPNWQIVLNGLVVATAASPNGWSFSGSTSTFTVGSPMTAATGDYQVQYNSGGTSVPYYGYSGSLSVVTGSAKPPTTFTWDSHGNLLSETSPRGTTTTYTYDYSHFALGELTQVQQGSKAPTTYAYFEPSGLPQSVTAPLPGTTGSAQTVTVSYTYDGLGNVLTVTAPGNNAASAITTTYNYTTDGSYSQSAAMGQPLTVTNNLGKVTHLRYDAQGNTVAVKDALGNETDMAYDIRNAPLQTILPATGQTGSGHGGSQTTYLYAEPSAFATAQWPAVTLQYGPATSVTSYDEGSVGAIRQVSYAYGPEGETLSVSGSTEPVAYVYDGLYRLKTLTDGGGHTTSYFYTPAGDTAQVVYPGASSTPPTTPLAAGSYDTITFPAYDADGNLLSRVDGNNVTTTYAYNTPDSLLTDIAYPAGSIGSVHLSYDAYGRRNAMTDGTGGQTYAYDDDDDLTSKIVTWTGLAAKTVSYGFYPNGSRSSMNADGHPFAYSYDGVGRMSSLTSDGALQASYAYQDNGWLQSKTLGNTDVTTYTRDAQGRLLDLANKTSGGATLSDFAVPSVGGYDGAGNKLAVTATIPNTGSSYSGTTHYQYDYGQSVNPQASRSQLTQATSTSYTGTENYLYDQSAPGQPGSSTGPGNATYFFEGADHSYNADNQLVGEGYDSNGNPTNYHSQTLTFDPENRLTIYGSLQTDGWSGDDLRAWKQTGGSTTRTYFLYDGSQPVGEYDSTGALRATNVFGADGLLSRLDPSSPVNSGRTYYSFDGRGAVTQRLYTGGGPYQTDLYFANGYRSERLLDYSDPWGFGAQAGYVTDLETGLMLCTHRFYDPNVGRFLTRDPMGYAGGINLYGYTGNDPVNRLDPNGYMNPGAVFAGAGAGGGGIVLGGIGEAGAGAGAIGVGVALAPVAVVVGLAAVGVWAGYQSGTAIADLIPGPDGLPAPPMEYRRPLPKTKRDKCMPDYGSIGHYPVGPHYDPDPDKVHGGPHWDYPNGDGGNDRYPAPGHPQYPGAPDVPIK